VENKKIHFGCEGFFIIMANKRKIEFSCLDWRFILMNNLLGWTSKGDWMKLKLSQ
jgi:hypothetical protein